MLGFMVTRRETTPSRRATATAACERSLRRCTAVFPESRPANHYPSPRTHGPSTPTLSPCRLRILVTTPLFGPTDTEKGVRDQFAFEVETRNHSTKEGGQSSLSGRVSSFNKSKPPTMVGSPTHCKPSVIVLGVEMAGGCCCCCWGFQWVVLVGG